MLHLIQGSTATRRKIRQLYKVIVTTGILGIDRLSHSRTPILNQVTT